MPCPPSLALGGGKMGPGGWRKKPPGMEMLGGFALLWRVGRCCGAAAELLSGG